MCVCLFLSCACACAYVHVCVRVCLCVYVYRYVYIYTQTHACMHPSIHPSIQTYIHIAGAPTQQTPPEARDQDRPDTTTLIHRDILNTSHHESHTIPSSTHSTLTDAFDFPNVPRHAPADTATPTTHHGDPINPGHHAPRPQAAPPGSSKLARHLLGLLRRQRVLQVLSAWHLATVRRITHRAGKARALSRVRTRRAHR